MQHLPVLLREVIEHLDPSPGDVILDGTCGGGGHSQEILEKIIPDGKLIAVDADPEAIKRVKNKFEGFGGSVKFINRNFRHIESILEEAGVKKLNGAVFDLGFSSFQIDSGHKGFSFLREGPLDMRFDQTQGITAKEVVNTFTREELAEVIRNFGEERHAKLVANAICSERRRSPLRTTSDLVDIASRALGRKYYRQRLHPAARTFQALRIFVNDELGALEEAIERTVKMLTPGARICVISFHSLEDRIVKHMFRDYAREGKVESITKKPICPGKDEVKANPRARSSKLRVAEKI